MRLLLIEDDKDLVNTLELAFRAAKFEIETTIDGEDGYRLATINDYDLIILDCNLPGLSGQEIVKRLRRDGRTMPILVLTILSEINSKVELFELGADDYLTKPFAISELMVRVNSLLRRSPTLKSKVLRIDNLELDANKFLVLVDNKRIPLSSKEFALLEYFMTNPSRVLTRQEIADHIWDENHDPFSNTIEVHVMHLRKKLGKLGKKLIETIPNHGYRLNT